METEVHRAKDLEGPMNFEKPLIDLAELWKHPC
jgi:hypothetical protein